MVIIIIVVLAMALTAVIVITIEIKKYSSDNYDDDAYNSNNKI